MKVIVNDHYTFECNEPCKVGETAVLPAPRAGKNGKVASWRGTITAIGSPYAGPCKTVLQVIHEEELPL